MIVNIYLFFLEKKDSIATNMHLLFMKEIISSIYGVYEKVDLNTTNISTKCKSFICIYYNKFNILIY